jgi:hypothetical protein
LVDENAYFPETEKRVEKKRLEILTTKEYSLGDSKRVLQQKFYFFHISTIS